MRNDRFPRPASLPPSPSSRAPPPSREPPVVRVPHSVVVVPREPMPSPPPPPAPPVPVLIPSPEALATLPVQACTCKKSRCLKLYCRCFSSSMSCGRKCKCVGCKNDDWRSEWNEARSKVARRNPRAFEDRKIVPVSAAPQGRGDVIGDSLSSSLPREFGPRSYSRGGDRRHRDDYFSVGGPPPPPDEEEDRHRRAAIEGWRTTEASAHRQERPYDPQEEEAIPGFPPAYRCYPPPPPPPGRHHGWDPSPTPPRGVHFPGQELASSRSGGGDFWFQRPTTHRVSISSPNAAAAVPPPTASPSKSTRFVREVGRWRRERHAEPSPREYPDRYGEPPRPTMPAPASPPRVPRSATSDIPPWGGAADVASSRRPPSDAAQRQRPPRPHPSFVFERLSRRAPRPDVPRSSQFSPPRDRDGRGARWRRGSSRDETEKRSTVEGGCDDSPSPSHCVRHGNRSRDDPNPPVEHVVIDDCRRWPYETGKGLVQGGGEEELSRASSSSSLSSASPPSSTSRDDDDAVPCSPSSPPSLPSSLAHPAPAKERADDDDKREAALAMAALFDGNRAPVGAVGFVNGGSFATNAAGDADSVRRKKHKADVVVIKCDVSDADGVDVVPEEEEGQNPPRKTTSGGGTGHDNEDLARQSNDAATAMTAVVVSSSDSSAARELTSLTSSSEAETQSRPYLAK